MEMDVRWKPFRVFNYLTDVCVNLKLCNPDIAVKDNSIFKKGITIQCLLIGFQMYVYCFLKTSRRKYEQMEKLEEAFSNCRKVIDGYVFNGSTNSGK